MGLDLYLYRQRYVRGDKAKKVKELVGEKAEGSVSVKTNVAYWRKANAIHRFFYDFTGEDEDTREIYIPYECLEELLKRCKEIKSKVKLIDGKVSAGYTYKDGKRVDMWEDGKVIKDSSLCEELLPTQEGFFFGDTDYNECYMDDINDTIEQLEQIMADDDRATDDYYYYGSW